MATLIKSTGEEIIVSPAKGKHFTLKELQSYVGGYIETLPVATSQLMIVNEEGKLLNLPINKRATEIAIENCVLDVIVGDILICLTNEMQ